MDGTAGSSNEDEASRADAAGLPPLLFQQSALSLPAESLSQSPTGQGGVRFGACAAAAGTSVSAAVAGWAQRSGGRIGGAPATARPASWGPRAPLHALIPLMLLVLHVRNGMSRQG